MADASKITTEEMSQAREEARRMISDADKEFQESLRGMNQSKRQLAIDRKARNDAEDKETARKMIEERKAEFMRNRPQPQQQPQPQPQQRQPTSTILVGPQLRVVSNNFRNNGGKRTQRRRKQQRKLKHKRYSSRYKKKSKSRR